jgi:hypothetical protein
MSDVRITCIRKPHPQSPHEHITHVGSNGQVWTREQVIAWIDARAHTFYTLDAYSRRADVGVVRESGKAPYLRTYADGVWNNNLLSLPQCT